MTEVIHRKRGNEPGHQKWRDLMNMLHDTGLIREWQKRIEIFWDNADMYSRFPKDDD